MGSLSGIFQRPALAASAVAIASVSADFYEKSGQSKPSSSTASSFSERDHSSCTHSLGEADSLWVSRISVSKLSQFPFLRGLQIPVPNVHLPIPSSELKHSLVASSTVLFNFYKSANLLKTASPVSYSYKPPSAPSDSLYQWHLPGPNSSVMTGSSCLSPNSKTVVVLLGWLGARQKHLRRYAEWYTSRGFHAITFTFPMSEVISYQVGGKAEQDVESLMNHLAEWMEEEDGKNLVFHTFSNTGWLTYGVMLEKFRMKDPALMQRIKGCIVDSAPVAAPDPQVFASGFSAAFLKKGSVATKPPITEPDTESKVGTRTTIEVKPAATEAVLLALLEKLFGAVLSHPPINRRLSEVLEVLTTEQPPCPQLYIYSSADRVIPESCVESFIEKQRRSGHHVRACNFISSPHVDHFRNNPELYSAQLQQFLKDCI